jgi:glucose-1-phosphate cytidylyltransferase
MKVVLLCGGKGSRLGEITAGHKPKPLVEINGRPILWHLMQSYARQGFSDFILCAGHLSWQIKDYFVNYQHRSNDVEVNTANGTVRMLSKSNEEWSVTIAETGEETQTAGRIARIAKYLNANEPFFLTYGDGLSNIDHNSVLAFHRSHGRMATITGIMPPGRFGELSLDGDRVAELREKPMDTDRYINGGFMVLERDFVDRYCAMDDADNVMLERAPLENAAKDDELMMYRFNGFWQCMDTARDWELLDKLARDPKAPWE